MLEENKLIEFVREVNADLDYAILQCDNNGYTEGIKLSETYVFDDDNDSKEYLRQKSLARLLRHLSLVSEVVEPMLINEIDLFFTQKKKELKDKFTNAKVKYNRVATCRYNLFISGAYNEDCMEQFIEVLTEDFKYLFEGFLIDCEY
jgi:hypothetical protein